MNKEETEGRQHGGKQQVNKWCGQNLHVVRVVEASVDVDKVVARQEEVHIARAAVRFQG